MTTLSNNWKPTKFFKLIYVYFMKVRGSYYLYIYNFFHVIILKMSFTFKYFYFYFFNKFQPIL
jgi:hypothetical protein